MKNYSDMNSREKVLYQFKVILCEKLSEVYTHMCIDLISNEGDQTDVQADMSSLGESFFEIMHKESLPDLKYYMIGHHGWDDETFEDVFFEYMSM